MTGAYFNWGDVNIVKLTLTNQLYRLLFAASVKKQTIKLLLFRLFIWADKGDTGDFGVC